MVPAHDCAQKGILAQSLKLLRSAANDF